MQGYVRTSDTKAKTNGFQLDAKITLGKGRRDVRQAGRAFDACKDSADEDGVKAEMYEFSKHFRVARQRV